MQVAETPKFSVPNWVRSVGAVVAGFVTCAASAMAIDAVAHATGLYPALGEPQPEWTLAVALTYRTVFTVAAGYVAAMLAPNHKLGHAVTLGVVGLVPAIAGTVAMWDFGHHWYPIALTLLAVPSTWLGGTLRTRR